MKTILQFILITLLTGIAAGAFGLSQNQTLDELQRDYDSSFSERSNLADELSALESEYKGLVRRIETIKRAGGADRITDRLALEDLLRRSQKLASKLSEIQTKIRGVDSRLDTKKQRMVRELELEMGSMEATLSTAKPSERAAIVGRLNAMRNAKVQYSRPLPALPNAAELDSTIKDSESDDPATMIAVADELEDAEDQLQARVVAIEKQLKNLENTRALIKRANKFETEENFFEESDRARIIARYDVTSGSKANTNTNANSNPVDNGGVAEEDGNNAAPSEGPVNLAAGGDDDAASDPGAFRENDSSQSVTDTPTADRTADAPLTTRSVRIDAGADPSRSVGSNSGKSGTSLGRQIRALQSEKTRLKNKARQLRERANRLRTKAESL